MAYRIYRADNYIYVVDNNSETIFEESSSNVIVKKQNLTDSVYDIVFYREQTTPQAFYNLNFNNNDILDQFGLPFPDITSWEKWYEVNTGVGSTPFAPSPGPATLISVVPGIVKVSGSNGTVPNSVYSVSFASIGTADALISFDFGLTYTAVKTGVTINMDAGAVLNNYPAGIFAYDTSTNPGAELIITYNIYV